MTSGVEARVGGAVETSADGDISGVAVPAPEGVQDVIRISIMERKIDFRSTGCSTEKMQVFYLKSPAAQRQEQKTSGRPREAS
jgi:hypothetical protein